MLASKIGHLSWVARKIVEFNLAWADGCSLRAGFPNSFPKSFAICEATSLFDKVIATFGGFSEEGGKMILAVRGGIRGNLGSD